MPILKIGRIPQHLLWSFITINSLNIVRRHRNITKESKDDRVN